MNVQAAVNYLTPQSERAFYVIRGAREGEPTRNVRGDRREVTVHDARALTPAPRLDCEGVELVAWGGAPEDEHDDEGVSRDFYPRVEAMVRKHTGARRVFAFDHNLRSSDERTADGETILSPVQLAHNDYTERSAPQRVHDLLPDEAEALLEHRVAVINVWKPIRHPALAAPLAVCDAQTLQASDWIETDLRYPDRTGEIYSVCHSPNHRWLYFPAMDPSETMLLKCYDSHGDRARFTAHTAIDDPTTPSDAPPRRSIEVRTLAFFSP